MSLVVTLLGAESTGKTTLAHALATTLAEEGRSVALVLEHLREFSEARGRTPREDEQAAIAQEQTRRIETAALAHDIVIADTSALMIAVYSEYVFGDRSLYDSALQAQRRWGLALVTALDLPWTADGWVREGEHVRAPVDGLLRAALTRGRLPYSVVSGHGPQRLAAALAAVRQALRPPPADDDADGAPPRWHWHCERCSDPDCERRSMLGLLGEH